MAEVLEVRLEFGGGDEWTIEFKTGVTAHGERILRPAVEFLEGRFVVRLCHGSSGYVQPVECEYMKVTLVVE